MGRRAWSVASAPDRLRSKPLKPPPDVEGAVASYPVQDRIPWKRGTPSGGGGGSFSATFQTFPEHMVARKRDPRCSPRGGTRFCASAVEHGKKQALLWLIFMGETMEKNRGKHQYFPYFQKMTASLRKGRSYPRVRRDGTFAAGMGCEWLARAPCAVVCNWARRPERAAGEGAGWGGSGCSISGRRRGCHRHAGGASGEGGDCSVASQPFSSHKVARKRDPPGGHSTGRDTLLHVRSGNSWRDNGARSCPRHPSPKSGWTSQRGTGKMANRHPVRFSRAGKQRERTGTKTK